LKPFALEGETIGINNERPFSFACTFFTPVHSALFGPAHALRLALLTLFATPASGQFLSDGVTPVNPIPNSNAILLAHIGNCLA
jgi:hypothetical protein